LSAKKPIKTAHGPSGQNGKQHQTAKNASSPVKVEPHDGSSSHETAKSEKQEQPQKASLDRSQIAVLIFTGLTTLATVGMYFSARSANTIAQAAATSAKQAVTAARLQVRAQVAVSEGRVSWRRGKADIQLTIKNTGQTKAQAVSIEIDIFRCEKYPLELGMFPMNEPITGSTEIREGVSYPLQSGGTFSHNRSLVISPADLQEIKKGKKAIYIVGNVNYIDEFDDPHAEPFSLMQGGPHGWNAAFMAAN
jgi:hypothetical protein